jgi:DNA-binding NarL/FixJ family response regulator
MQKSIMIVDDSEMIRGNLRRLLSRSTDWTICAEAVDGCDAVEKAKLFRPDFIVMDFCMPNMDGLEAARKIKNLIPKSSIVMLSVFKDGYLEKKAYEAGISWVLAKGEAGRVVDFARILLRSDPAFVTASAASIGG